jgi:quercetin dioxygenase-like cupin family protein
MKMKKTQVHFGLSSLLAQLNFVHSVNANRGQTTLGLLTLLVALLSSRPTQAETVTPLGTGQLPSGDFIVMTQLTLNPGESVPWHYHLGTGLRVVLSGTLTVDDGCGNPLAAYAPGTAFEEAAGHVHRIFNLGTDPVVVLRTDLLPSCYLHQGTIFVTGPDCEGNSGRSHLEPVQPCPSETSQLSAPKSEWLLADGSQGEPVKSPGARLVSRSESRSHPLQLAFLDRGVQTVSRGGQSQDLP